MRQAMLHGPRSLREPRTNFLRMVCRALGSGRRGRPLPLHKVARQPQRALSRHVACNAAGPSLGPWSGGNTPWKTCVSASRNSRGYF